MGNLYRHLQKERPRRRLHEARYWTILRFWDEGVGCVGTKEYVRESGRTWVRKDVRMKLRVIAVFN